MKTRCPACGATCSLDALLGHGDASQAFVASLNLTGDLAKPIIQYLGMFRSENRDLTFERASKLLNELAADINANQIKRGHHFHPAPYGQSIRSLNDETKANCNYRSKITAIYMKSSLHISLNIPQYRIQAHDMQQLRLHLQKLMQNGQLLRLNMNARNMNVQQCHLLN